VSIGNLLAAAAFALVTLLPREDLMSWGWRLPFLASFLLILIGIFVRLKVAETPVFTEAVVARGKIERNPAMEALRRHPRNFMVVLGARLAENGLGYLFPVFGLNYVINTLGVPKAEALSALMLAFVIELFAIVGFATLSDRIGRRPVYMFGALAGVAFAFPFFWLVATKEWIWIAVAFIGARASKVYNKIRMLCGERRSAHPRALEPNAFEQAASEDENVHPAVVIVVEKGATTTHNFGQIGGMSSSAVSHHFGETCGFRNIHKIRERLLRSRFWHGCNQRFGEWKRCRS